MIGAGPAGLAAAITLARGGCKVIAHEAHSRVGQRFRSDLQGLENWSSACDALEDLGWWGLPATFARIDCREGTAFDAWGQANPIRSRQPLFHMVERGCGAGILDSMLLRQACELGLLIMHGREIVKSAACD